jgi:hypothetical protein
VAGKFRRTVGAIAGSGKILAVRLTKTGVWRDKVTGRESASAKHTIRLSARRGCAAANLSKEFISYLISEAILSLSSRNYQPQFAIFCAYFVLPGNNQLSSSSSSLFSLS